ncbi:MAG: metallophosphatase family protein [Acidobacteria bacterium]|nr:metallophosphatase family protein [Acidobacteriota bacterium]
MPPARVAALYDIHGNLPALEAVLGEVRAARVDRIVVGGDVVPGPMPRESLACLLDLEVPVQFIQGNGDREVVAPTGAVPEPFREALRWNAGQLSAEEHARLAGWPPTLRITIDGVGDVLFCHATPRNDTEIFTRNTPDDRLLPIFGALDVALAVCGHTHMAFDRMVGRVRVVNAGSVGMPFGEPGAYWLLLGPHVELRRTAYDFAKAADRVRATDYPQAEEFAARNILAPPAEAAILAAFAHAELT